MTMRRIVVLAALCSALASVLLAPSGAEAAFPQCPPVFRDTSCQFLITVTGGVVNFSPALAPGQSTYFSLESPPTGKSITVGTASTLSTVLSGGGSKGPVIGVVRGTPVTDTATVGGTAAATASGKVNYK